MTRSCALFASAAVLLAGCVPGRSEPPDRGLLLLSLHDGAPAGRLDLGVDPIAVAVSEDGRVAYVADDAGGDVYAVGLPRLAIAWRTHVGGGPDALLVAGGSVKVARHDAGTVTVLDAGTGAILSEFTVAAEPGELAAWRDGTAAGSGADFGVAVAGGDLWRADHEGAAVVDTVTGARAAMPAGTRPFWLAPGRAGELLVSCEGDPEDGAPGAVVAVDTATLATEVLARPVDPDQVELAGSDLFVAAHGDRGILVRRGGNWSTWARGAGAVGLAADPPLGLLVVLDNARE